MEQRTLRIFHKTEHKTVLRLLDANRLLVEDRELDKAEVDAWVAEIDAQYRQVSPELDTIGRRLYDWLDGPNHRWLAKLFADHLALTLHIDAADRLRHLPWELMQQGGAFLCANPLRPFCPVRFVRDARRPVERANRPLRVLFMACSPEDVQPVLSFEDEERRILNATQKHPTELVVEESGSLTGLQERIESLERGYFDVFHLSGHATVRDNTPIFLMEDDLGFKHEATAKDIARAFGGNWPRLVFLSGCKTGQAVERGVLPSLCEALVQAGAPAVLGWALPVYDETANVAASELYGELAVAKRIDAAIAHTRQQLFEKNAPDWHLLRLYADATPLSELVTPLRIRNRAHLKVREAAAEFIDAGAKSEVCPRALFVGRRRLIQRCLRVLHKVQGEDGYAEGVLLHGMGGLGKSSLAARLCERMTSHRRLVWVGAIDEMELRKVLSDRLASPVVIEILNTERLSIEQRLRRILELPLDDAPFLFVFDDFEQNIETDSNGTPILKPQARDILSALLNAIRETASESRVLITSWYTFPLPGPAHLYEEGLESMRGAELRKFTTLLPNLGSSDPAREDLHERAKAIADGNPRLLHRLDSVLADPDTDLDAVFAAMESVEAKFREEVLIEKLVKSLPNDCRRTMALLALLELPVDETCVSVTAAHRDVSAHLKRAVALGLIESGRLAGDETLTYYVSRIVTPFLEDELTDDERVGACRAAAIHLNEAWWVKADGASLERLLEIHRLALLSHEGAIAAGVAYTVSSRWIQGARYREAEYLCSITLSVAEDYRILHNLARAEAVLGKAQAAREHYVRALELCPALTPSMDPKVKKERGHILYNLAALLAQFGEIQDAMALYEQSGQIDTELGDVQARPLPFTRWRASSHSRATSHALSNSGTNPWKSWTASAT